MARIHTAAALLSFVAFCSGCGTAGFQIRQAVGLDKNPPDAFVIMPTRDLEMPRDFSVLPPPAPGAASPLEADPRALAISALGGAPAQAPGAPVGLRAAPAAAVASGPIYNGPIYTPAPSGAASGLGGASLGAAPISRSAPTGAAGFAASLPSAAPLYAAGPSSAEAALLSAAGAAAPAPADLRASLAAESTGDSGYLLDRWMPGLQRLRGVQSGAIVDPLVEMRRLGQAAPEAETQAATAAVSPLLIPPSAAAAGQ